MAQCYARWRELQGKVRGYYTEEIPEVLPLSKQKEFRNIKNIIVKEAEKIRTGTLTFEDESIRKMDEPASDDFITSERYQTAKAVIQGQWETIEELDEAVSEMRDLAENGDVYAQYALGKMYRDHIGVLPDAMEAKKWFSLAAGREFDAAQYALGKLLLSGDAEICNPKEGINWLQRAFENGNDYAGYRLGKELLQGINVPEDVPSALDYLTKSAELGNPYAQYMLGKLYQKGRFVERNQERASHWFSQSADQGNPYAQFLIGQQQKARSPSILLAATNLLRDLARLFQENSVPRATSQGIRVDSKLRRKLKEKKIALGHAESDHEDYGIQFNGY